MFCQSGLKKYGCDQDLKVAHHGQSEVSELISNEPERRNSYAKIKLVIYLLQ